MSSIPRSFVALLALAAGTFAKPNFMGNFVLSDLSVDSPFQAQPNATANSSVCFTFTDQDLPDATPVHCTIEWAVGLSPPAQPQAKFCDNTSVSVWLPQDTYKGVANLTIQLSHTYIDNSVGEYPYNILSKFGSVNLTYPGTPNYECETNEAHCYSCEGTSIVAAVTQAVA